MFKKKSFWIILVVVLAIAAGGYYYYTTQIAPAKTAEKEEPAMQTAVARQGELSVFASGAGSIIPGTEISLGFNESGTLIDLYVQVGDHVQEGEVLALLQTKDTEESIASSIADAELAVVKAEQALDDLYANAEIARTTALSNIAVYAQEVRDAQYQLENYTMPTNLQNLETIEALDLMKQRLDEASASFEPYRYYSASNSTRRSLLEDLNEAQSNYDAAVKRLNYEYELQVAEANLEKVRNEYDKYQDGPATDELALAEAELVNAQAKLALAQDEESVLELAVPMDGTVMEVTASVGEYIGTTSFVTLAKLDHVLLEVYLDETDLEKVAPGYDAEVVFDALPDDIFKGYVTTVFPGLETISNVQAIKTYVLLDDGEIDGNTNLPVGMNASVDIIAGRAEDAILVPVEALRELGPNEFAVFVLENDEPVLRVVQVGLVDITSAEILSGLQAGDIVTTGIVQAQ